MKPITLLLILFAVYMVTTGFKCKKDASPCTTFKAEITYDDANGVLGTQTIHGTAPFNYTWSNGQTGTFVIASNPGTYVVTITDANGCTSSDEQVVP